MLKHLNNSTPVEEQNDNECQITMNVKNALEIDLKCL